MKTMKFILFLMMLMLIAACSKNGLIPGDSSQPNGENALLKNGHIGEVFTVLPNGTDDTSPLLMAFDAAKLAGPGSVVQLVEGVYNIGFTEIRDFHGYFRGAGKDKTKVQNMDNLPSVDPIYANNMFEMLISFVGGDVHISKMTFTTRDGNICPSDMFGVLYVLMGLSDYTALYIPPKRFIKAVVEDVDFIGGFVNPVNAFGTDHNVWMPLLVGANFSYPTSTSPFSSADVTIRSCRFDHVGIGPDVWGLDEKSTLIIEENTIKNSLYDLFIGANLGLKAYIRNNQFINSPMGTYIDDNDWGLFSSQSLKKRSEFYISGNYCQSPAGATSLFMNDYRRTIYPDEGLPQLFNVRNNIFSTQEGGIAINSSNNSDAKIWDNKFLGTGADGVVIDGDQATNTYAENINLIGNNFFSANYSEACVYLGPFSRNCKVVGISKDKVVDEGVNNSVIGTKAHKTGVHSGQYLHNNPRFNQKNFMRRRIN